MSESSLYKTALSLAQQGDLTAALSNIRRYLELQTEDGEAWNDAGVLLYRLNRTDEAIDCLEKARRLDCQRELLCRNLFHAYTSAGRICPAKDILDELSYCETLDAQLIREGIDNLVTFGDTVAAQELALEAQRYLPDSSEIRAIADRFRLGRAKIAFFCGGDGDTFLKDIYACLSKRFTVQMFDAGTVEQLQQLMAWSDISWFEWCTNLAEIGSKLPKVCRNIVRLHRYEAYEGWCSRINWDNVDLLITVGNSAVDEVIRQQIGTSQTIPQMATIPNGLDMQRIRFVRRKRGKNIAFVGNLRMVKNPMLLLQCMKKLRQIDPGYRLFIAGRYQDLLVEQYTRHMIAALGLQDAIVFDGWQENIESWLADKHYIVLTSVIESQGMGMLEGMASGLKGAIHNFPGADGIYPASLLFNTPEEFCGIITSPQYSPGSYRAFVEQRYSFTAQINRISHVIRDLELKKMDTPIPLHLR